MTGCTYTSGATLGKKLTILGGTVRQGGTALTVTGSDAVMDGMTFDGGSNTVVFSGGDRNTIRNSKFINMRETSIRIQGGADDLLIETNSITQTINTGHGYSPISSNDASGHNSRMTIRNNTIDQGPSGVAWFGIEVWGVSNLVISGNNLKGASALISIPRSDGAQVDGNTFSGDFFWGAEFADISNAKFRNNIVHGNSVIGGNGRAVVQMNPGSGTVDGITITGNRLDHENALLNAAGSGHIITDNCGGWDHLYNVTGPAPNGDFVPGTVTIARNGPC